MEEKQPIQAELYNPELGRILNSPNNKGWKKWGPYLTERQWGTVREDYSPDGSAWEFISHEKARSNAYRWGEEGIGGICDHKGVLCFSIALWNEKDPILKERLYGLTGNEGNHGEDVKELYYYLDSTPTHSYMKMLYKYPQEEFPYRKITEENRKRGRLDPEYEIYDTGAFDNNKYFDIYIEYAKNGIDDILINITAVNNSDSAAPIHILPTLWFRNDWPMGGSDDMPQISQTSISKLKAECSQYGTLFLYHNEPTKLLFCDNETNHKKVYGGEKLFPYTKDGINDFVIHGDQKAVNPYRKGTKAASHYQLVLEPGESRNVQLRFTDKKISKPFENFFEIIDSRKSEADVFFGDLQKNVSNEEHKSIQRQALAGMLWTKQFYYYDMYKWIHSDGVNTPKSRIDGRNRNWQHLSNKNILSMPDKWEYPWYAAWDLAFHCIPLAHIDPSFAKRQLALLLREYYMHPNGQMPAYEWNFSDVNPPVHAWAIWKVYEIDKKINGKADTDFLERNFQKLLMNFTWWVNRKDANGQNVFEGGFLGLDNIGVFDRSNLPPGIKGIEQADATSWMAMYSLNMLMIALELSTYNVAYEESASKFFQHFMYINGAMSKMGSEELDLWDDKDNFYYDVIHLQNGKSERMKIRSLVGIIPMFAVEIITHDMYEHSNRFKRRTEGFLDSRPDLARLVSRIKDTGFEGKHLLSVIRGFRLGKILIRLLDENEFLSPYGIRSLSKFHLENPFEYKHSGSMHKVQYLPGESDSGMFGGNSNWRGPIWFPLNYLIIQSLEKYYEYYGESYKYDFPTGSGNKLNMKEIAVELRKRLLKIFELDEEQRRPYLGDTELLQKDGKFRDNLLFYEFFHGDSGKGLGASHQTGWTGLIAELIFEMNQN